MPNNTLHNGFHLLETMARNPKPWSIAELSITLNLPRSHVHRLLTSLTELGYLHRPEKSRLYQVDVKLFELASALAAEHPLRRLCSTGLRRLADRTRGSAYLIVWHNLAPMILAVDHFGGKRLTQLEVGKRLDLHSTASGKLFMALLGYQPAAGELAAMTPHTITDREALAQELALIRTRQVAISRKEAGVTLVAFALPVYDRENPLPVAAIGLVIPAERSQPENDPQWVGACAETARNLSAALGFTGNYPVDPDLPELALSRSLPTAVPESL